MIPTLIHGYLKAGHIKKAQMAIEQHFHLSQDFEAIYLKGVLCYRKGLHHEALKIWKPIISYQPSTIKEHHIKQSLLTLYFEHKKEQA
jgi:hypothetical protein